LSELNALGRVGRQLNDRLGQRRLASRLMEDGATLVDHVPHHGQIRNQQRPSRGGVLGDLHHQAALLQIAVALLQRRYADVVLRNHPRQLVATHRLEELNVGTQAAGLDLLLQLGAPGRMLGRDHRQPHAQRRRLLERISQREQERRQTLPAHHAAQVEHPHGNAVGPCLCGLLEVLEVDARAQEGDLCRGHAELDQEVAGDRRRSEHRIGRDQAGHLLLAERGHVLTVALEMRVGVAQLDAGQAAGVEDQLEWMLRLHIGEELAAERVGHVNDLVLVALELTPGSALERLHPRGQIARAHGHPHQPGAEVTLDVSVVGCLDGQHIDGCPTLERPQKFSRTARQTRRLRNNPKRTEQDLGRGIGHVDGSAAARLPEF
jgi:hypothetical protein